MVLTAALEARNDNCPHSPGEETESRELTSQPVLFTNTFSQLGNCLLWGESYVMTPAVGHLAPFAVHLHTMLLLPPKTPKAQPQKPEETLAAAHFVLTAAQHQFLTFADLAMKLVQ
jgi:hypothetical protein